MTSLKPLQTAIFGVVLAACGPPAGPDDEASIDLSDEGGVGGGTGGEGSGQSGGGSDGGGTGSTTEIETSYEACVYYYSVVIECFEDAGYTAEELGLDVGYCEDYADLDDDSVTALFLCYSEIYGSVDCASDEVIAEASERAALECSR